MTAGTGRALAELVLGGAAGLWTFVTLAWLLRVRDLAFFRSLLPARAR
jgi:hypothetical protein